MTKDNKFERFRAMFLNECDEHVRTLEKSLTALQRGGRSQDLVDDAFRAIHSIKGGAGMLGFDRVVPFAHTFEAVLEGVRLKSIAISEHLIAAALRATDCLADLIVAAGSGTDLPASHESAAAAHLAKAAGLATETAPESVPAPRPDIGGGPGRQERFHILFKPHAGLLRRANEPLFLVRQLRELGTLEVSADLSGLPSFDDLQPTDAHLGWTFELATEAGEAAVRNIFEFVEGDCDLAVTLLADDTPVAGMVDASGQAVQSNDFTLAEPAISTIRVDIERIDRLVNLAGEIAISQALVAQQIDQALVNTNPRLFQELSQLLTHTQNLQDSVMAIRAQPIRAIFDRMPRLVRELAEQTGKKIILRTAGEATEIDKTVIEQLSDPIMHMIRNSADHGLEPEAERLSLGKPAEGVITLGA